MTESTKLAVVAELKLALSVGVKTAVKVAVLVSLGVHAHVARPSEVALLPHPEIVIPEFLKLKEPSVVETAVSETGEP